MNKRTHREDLYFLNLYYAKKAHEESIARVKKYEGKVVNNYINTLISESRLIKKILLEVDLGKYKQYKRDRD